MLERRVEPHVAELREAFTQLRESGHAPTIVYPSGLHEGRIVVCLPLPPSVNSAFPTVRGRRVKSGTYLSWLAESEWYAKGQGTPHVNKRKERTFWSLDTYFFFENWRSDMDNRYKALIDWLCTRLGLQDNYLLEHYSRRFNVDAPNYGGELTGVIAVVSIW